MDSMHATTIKNLITSNCPFDILTLINFIKKEITLFDWNEWLYFYQQCPQQPNTWDCGIHCCMHVLAKATDLKVINYDPSEMDNICLYIMECIIGKKLLWYELWLQITGYLVYWK
jgi:Ulp1 family protease